MKIKMLGEPYGRFIQVTFPEQITFTEYSDCTDGTFTLDELKSFVEIAKGYITDFEILRDDPSNVDTDPPDEYNVFEDEDGHDCKATVDGG